jgi:hypothetical protein
MSSRFQEDRADEARAARLAAQTEAFKQWLGAKHSEIRFCEALFREVKEYMRDSFLVAGPEDFQYTVDNIDTRGVKQHVPTEEETRTDLTDRICGLLRNPNGGTAGGKYSDFDIKSFRTKGTFMSVADLQQRLEEIVRKQTISAMTPAERREIVQSARKYVGYPQLGKTIVRHGTVRAVPLDAAYLHGLDAWELKKFCRLYGAEQVNARLVGKD